MRAFLGLEREDLTYLQLKPRASNSLMEIDEIMRAKLRPWNTLDTLLYDFLLQLFWEKMHQFGQERSSAVVVKLRTSMENIQQKCVSRVAVPPAELEDLVRPWQPESVTIVRYKVRGNLSMEGFCVRMMLPELQYHSHLYFKQYGRYTSKLLID